MKATNDKPCEHVIGIVYNYEDTTLATYASIRNEHTEARRSLAHFCEHPEQDASDLLRRLASKMVESTDLSKMLDKRNGKMRRFSFCPECGVKINWDKLRQRAKRETYEEVQHGRE